MVRNTAPVTENRSEETDTTRTVNGWPLAVEHEHRLQQTLEFVNDALRRSQTVYDLYFDGGIEAADADAAHKACKETTEQLVEAGETVESIENMSPDLGAIPEEEVDACTTFYSKVGEVNASLETAWEEMSTAAAAADELNAGSDWGKVTDSKQIVTRLADARDALWKAQARLEELLIENFDHSEEDFERPAADFDW